MMPAAWCGAATSATGFAHFLRHGVAELRTPSEPIDLSWYATQESVKRDLDAGARLGCVRALGHYWPGCAVCLRLRRCRWRSPRSQRGPCSAVGRARCRCCTPGRSCNSATTATPALSVIMVLHNQFELTMLALGSLRANYPGDIDLVLIDSGSTDETCNIERYVKGATHFRFDTNIGFLRRLQRGIAVRHCRRGAVPEQRCRTCARRDCGCAAPAGNRSGNRRGRRHDSADPRNGAGSRQYHLLRRFHARLWARCLAAGARSEFHARCGVLLRRLPDGATVTGERTGGLRRSICASLLRGCRSLLADSTGWLPGGL